MARKEDFKKVKRFDGAILVHKSQPVWIVGYPAVEGVRAAYWQGYRAVPPLAKGRTNVWANDNRRIGNERGFPSVEAAIAAV